MSTNDERRATMTIGVDDAGEGYDDDDDEGGGRGGGGH